MTESDEYFPRGSVAPDGAKARAGAKAGDDSPQKKTKRKTIEKLQNLFVEYDEKPAPKRKPKKSKNALTPQEEKELVGKCRSEQQKRFAVVPLSHEQIVEGLLSLGVITKIRAYEMSVSLPGRTSGTVSITNVSTPYLNILEKRSTEEEKEEQDDTVLYTLQDMFHVGQCVMVKVVSVERSESHTKIALSMNPKDLHGNYSTGVLKQDLVMVAAVSSQEDHGYVMDIGINGARCFLPKQDANKFVKRMTNNRPLGIGQLVYCKISKLNVHRVMADVVLTAIPKAVQSEVMNETLQLNYSMLLPGMLVESIVAETHRTGLLAHCLEFSGLLHQDHISDPWFSPESYRVSDSLSARILYILPNLTSPYLTTQSEAVPLVFSGDQTDRTKLGSKEKVKVVRREKRGIIVRFPDNCKGLIPVGHLQESVVTKEAVSKKYQQGKEIECRVYQYSAMDRLYLCSAKKDHLKNDIIHIEKAQPGMNVSCTILKWNKGGAIVAYSEGLRGFIPLSQFKDRRLSEGEKEKLIGTIHKGRILEKDSSNDKIILTARKELVNSKGAVITSLEEAKVGMVGNAIIKHISKFGVYVSVIGGVEGFIPASKLSTVKLGDFREAFHKGQVIPYKVLDTVPAKNHLLMTAVVEEDELNCVKVTKKQKRKKRKKGSETEAPVKEEEDSDERDEPARKKKKKKDANEVDSIEVKEEIEEMEGDKTGASMNGSSDALGLSLEGVNSFWDCAAVKSEPESELDSEEETKKSKKKMSKLRQAQIKVDSEEPTALKSSKPDTVELTVQNSQFADQYEKGVFNTPDDPKFWTGVMSCYCTNGEIDKARAVARRAFDMINFRDEKAKLQVWGALFNLELQYGTQDTMKSTLAEALQRNDEFECLKLLALVYDNGNRFRDAEKTYRQLTGKFKLEPDAWVRFGTFYYQRKRADAAREVLNEALPLIEQKHHALLISKFALLEFRHAEASRGAAMLDRLLSQYPLRSDIWILYANALIKNEQFDLARDLFYRALENSWNPKKVKPLLKRFQEFETAHGDESQLEDFQKLALKVLNIPLDE